MKSLILIGIMCLLFTSIVNATNIKHDYYDTNDDNSGLFSSANYHWAQAFRTGRSLGFIDGIFCTGVQVLLYRVGDPNGVKCSIRDMETVPGSVDSVYASVDCSNIATSSPYTWVWFNFSSPYYLDPDVSYAVVVNNYDWATNNYIRWRCDATSPTYSYGSAWYSTTGSSWTVSTADMMFRVYGYNSTSNPTWIENSYLDCDSMFVNWTYASDSDAVTLYFNDTYFDFTNWDLSPANKTIVNYTIDNLACGTTIYTVCKAYNNTYALWSTGSVSKDTTVGDCSLTLIENLDNVTGSHTLVTSNCENIVWANYTGNISECQPTNPYWFNFTDDNITVNIHVLPDNETGNLSYIISDNVFILPSVTMLSLFATGLFIIRRRKKNES